MSHGVIDSVQFQDNKISVEENDNNREEDDDSNDNINDGKEKRSCELVDKDSNDNISSSLSQSDYNLTVADLVNSNIGEKRLKKCLTVLFACILIL